MVSAESNARPRPCHDRPEHHRRDPYPHAATRRNERCEPARAGLDRQCSEPHGRGATDPVARHCAGHYAQPLGSDSRWTQRHQPNGASQPAAQRQPVCAAANQHAGRKPSRCASAPLCPAATGERPAAASVHEPGSNPPSPKRRRSQLHAPAARSGCVRAAQARAERGGNQPSERQRTASVHPSRASPTPEHEPPEPRHRGRSVAGRSADSAKHHRAAPQSGRAAGLTAARSTSGRSASTRSCRQQPPRVAADLEQPHAATPADRDAASGDTGCSAARRQPARAAARIADPSACR